jgi:hypothetical protein
MPSRQFMQVHIRLTLVCAFAGTILTAQQPVDRPPQARMESIRALGLPSLSGGGLATYFSPGNETRARSLQAFVLGERSFYRARLGVPLNDLVLAVLNPQQWQPVSAPIPYGMPSVEGHPRVIVMPAGFRGGFVDGFRGVHETPRKSRNPQTGRGSPHMEDIVTLTAK